MRVLSYQIDDTPLTMMVDGTVDGDRVRNLLEGLFWMTPNAPCPTDGNAAAEQGTEHRMPLSLVVRGGPVVVSPPRSAAAYAAHDGVWLTADGPHFCVPAGHFAVNAAQQQAVGVIDVPFWESTLYAQRGLFMRTMIALLRQRDHYCLHAGALCLPPTVANADDGLLIVGASGAGKSTLTLGLLTAGWTAVGDNVVGICQVRDDELSVVALQRGFSCTEATLRHFPQFRCAGAQLLDPVRGKTLIYPERLYPTQQQRTMRPRLVLFPSVVDAPTSTLLPLDPTTAMVALLQQSPGLLAAQEQTPTQLRRLRALVAQCRAFQLLSGRDLLVNPASVGTLIAEAFAAH